MQTIVFRPARSRARPSRPQWLASLPLLVLGIACSDTDTPDRDTPAADLVIDGVSVLDTESGAWATDRTIFIADGRITAVMERGAVATPESAEVIAGDGRYVVPGLWDAHVHSVSARAWHFPLMLAHGVTAVRNMHTTESDPLAAIAAVRDDIRSGTVLPIRFIANGPIIDGDPPTWESAIALTDPARAAAIVDSLANGGADFFKVYDMLPADVFTELANAAQGRGIAIHGHVPFAVRTIDAARSMRTTEHLSGMFKGCSTEEDAVALAFADLASAPPLPFPENQAAYLRLLRRLSDTEQADRCNATIAAYAAGGVYATPTLINGVSMVQPGPIVNSPEANRLLPRDIATEWQQMTAGPGPGDLFAGIMQPVVERSPSLVRRLHDGGVPLLVGTDVGNPFLVPGLAVHQELALLVEAGLTPFEAIQAATLNPAGAFGLSDSLGLARPGFVADLVLLDANPTDDISAISTVSAVVLRGRHLGRGALDSLLTVAREASRE